MNQLKDSYQPLLAFAVLAVAGLLIKPVQERAARPVREEGDRGDDQRPRAGHTVEVLRRDACARRCSGCLPRATSASACRSCLMAAGCSSGSSPTRSCARIRKQIIDRFEPEFEKLLLLAMMLPWE